MGKKLSILFTVLLISVLVVSCSPAAEVPVVEEGDPPVEETALLVGDVAFTMEKLETMETLEVEYTSKDGEVTTYSGVLVMDLLDEAGLRGETLVLTASDGYEAELALSELEGCGDCVVAFDDGELRMVLPGFPGNVQVKGVVELSVK